MHYLDSYPSFAAEAVKHIEALLAASPWDDFGQFNDCRFCFERQWHGPDYDGSKHASDCAYVKAQRFLEVLLAKLA